MCGKTELLYCVASQHSFNCSYTWKNARGSVGVNSPALYVKLPGVYQCTVKRGEHEVTSSEMFVVEGRVQMQGRVQMIISTCIIVTCGYYYFLKGHGDVEKYRPVMYWS